MNNLIPPSPSSSSSSSSSSIMSNHHRYHNHHGSSSFFFPRHQASSSMFSICRLRLTLYFICILAITTSLYCLLSFRPNGLKSSPFTSSSSNSHPIVLLTSSSQILDEIIHNANKYYLNYFQYKKNVPTGLSFATTSIVSLPSHDNRQDELSKLIFMIDNLTLTADKSKFDFYNIVSDGKYLQERDNNLEYFEYEDDFEIDPSTVEYHLTRLGFDLKHIIYLYALSHPENVSITNSSSSNQNPFMKSLSSTNYEARFHQRHIQQQNNLSALLPQEFLNSIIFITAISSNQFHLGIDFLKSFEDFRTLQYKANISCPDAKSNFVLMIYDLGMYPEQLRQLGILCNKTNENHQGAKTCEIRTFQYEIYPSHVSDLRMAAYRSIILQEMLRDIKFSIKYRNFLDNQRSELESHAKSKVIENNVTLIWLDPHYRFLNSKYHMVLDLQNETLRNSGILSWPIEQPTSALTHSRMFEYFHTTKENFYFHRMIRPGHLIISIDGNSWEPFEWGIMLPWVRCALTNNCIAPLGSQWRSSCRLDKKPHYRFSGCHHYDMSALNVILGIAFNYSSSQYTGHLGKRFFSPINKPPSSLSPLISNQVIKNEDDDISEFENQFEMNEFKVSGRFDLIMNDDDIPEPKSSSTLSSNNLLLSSRSALLPNKQNYYESQTYDDDHQSRD